MTEIMNMTAAEFKQAQAETEAFLSKVFLIGRAASQAVECPDLVEE